MTVVEIRVQLIVDRLLLFFFIFLFLNSFILFSNLSVLLSIDNKAEVVSYI